VCHDETEAAGIYLCVKAEVVELIRASGKIVGAVTKDLGLKETAVRSSVRQADIDGGGGASGALTSAT
jgi:hypothetical protein